MTPAEFWARVRRGPGSCWLWTGAMHPFGYGEFTHQQRKHRAHRYAYEIAVGPIPPGAHVLHSCDTPACCNPAHLRLGDAQANADDKETRGRGNQPRGERNGRAVLTVEQVREVRRRRAGGEQYTTIGADLGIDASHARRIARRDIWRHVD